MKKSVSGKLNIKLILVHITFWGFILGLPVFYHFWGPLLDSANYENRNMTEKPVFSLETVSSYPLQYESYYNDNYPFRNKMIMLNGRFSYQILKEGTGFSIVGKDDWLFYKSEASNDGINIAQYKGRAQFSEMELKFAAKSLMNTKQWCDEHGMEFVLFIAPNKERMYSEYMPGYYNSSRVSDTCNTDQLVEYLRENTDIRVVWAYEDLSEYKSAHPDEPLYYHLDTHWNYLGGYIGARALLEELGIEIPPAEEREKTIRNTKTGDLLMLMNLGSVESVDDVDYAFAGYPVEGMEMVSDDVNGALMYRNPGADPRKVLIYRDSFCNIMRYFLGEQFSEISMVPHELWQNDLPEIYQPDVLVYELTERFVDNLVTEHIQPY